MGQNLLFYTVAGIATDALMHRLGFGWGAALFGSFIVPPLILIAWKVGRIKGIF
jgi:hypothetical protein